PVPDRVMLHAPWGTASAPGVKTTSLPSRRPTRSAANPGLRSRFYEPAVVLRLVGVEIVENDMDLPLWMLGHDLVHEVEDADAPAAAVVFGVVFAAGTVERRDQGGGAMPLVVMGLAGERAPIGQLEIALRPLQRLDRRLLVHRQHQRAVGRIKIK